MHPSQFLVYEDLAELHLKKAAIEKSNGRHEESEVLKKRAIQELTQASEITQALFSRNSAHTKRIHARMKLESLSN